MFVSLTTHIYDFILVHLTLNFKFDSSKVKIHKLNQI
jgi:hypothetical protein